MNEQITSGKLKELACQKMGLRCGDVSTFHVACNLVLYGRLVEPGDAFYTPNAAFRCVSGITPAIKRYADAIRSVLEETGSAMPMPGRINKT